MMNQKTLKTSHQAKVFILPEAKKKLDAYVSLAIGEISGLGKIRKVAKGVLLIEDVFIFDQDCTPVETNLNLDKVAEFLTEMIMAGEDTSCIRLWWHSHANMDTFWSHTDNTTISGFNNEWMVSLVTNFDGDYLCRVDTFQPMQMTAHDVLFHELVEADTTMVELLRAEVEEKVRHTVPAPVVYVKGAKSGYVAPDGVDLAPDAEFDQ
jgi:hypothetical protein